MLDNEVHHNKALNNNNGVVQGSMMMNSHSSLLANHHHFHHQHSHPLSDMCSAAAVPLPDTPEEGIVMQICYVGACFSEGRLARRRIRARFPGMEVAGVVHAVGEAVPNGNFAPGDKVVLFPDEQLSSGGYSEFLAVRDLRQVMKLPRDDFPLDVAAMLPGGALTAYAALLAAKPHVEKLQQVKSCVNVLVVGGGGLGLWAIKLARLVLSSSAQLMGQGGVRLYIADSSIDKLLVAQEQGSCEIVHWNEEDHEEYIVERTLDACRGGIDVIIDFVSSPRTMQRSLKVLNRSVSVCLVTQEGMVMVGGSNGGVSGGSTSRVHISLNTLAAKQHSIVGIPNGNMNQLRDLIGFVAAGELEPPCYAVFPVEDMSQVFDDLCECRITGRAVFKVGNRATASTVTDN